jgi:hypothetical protein
MDEEALLHRLSVDTNVNIELLKDLLHNDELWALVVAGKTIEAIMKLRDLAPRVGLREAKMVVEAFSAELK